MVKLMFHLADLHIRTFRLHDEYRDTLNNLLVEIRERVSGYDREEVRIVIAGDLVHQKIIVSNEQMVLLTNLLQKLEEIAPVIIIAGNHDLNLNNKDRLDSITPVFQFLSDKDINYFKESKCYLDNNIVWCIYSVFEDNKRPDIEGARLEFGNDKTYVGLFHAPIINAKTDIGYSIDHGSELEIFEGCDMVMLGDIHMHQSFIHKDIPIAYSSSIIQQSYGENVSGHGFLVWRVEDKSFEFVDVKNDYPYYQFRITSLKDLENNNEIPINL